MALDDGVVVAAKVTLSTVIALGLSVKLNVEVDLGIARIKRRLNLFILQIKQWALLRMALLPFRTACTVFQFRLFR